jgi:hypothetical protein
MDIYLTDLDTGNRLRFPILPERISAQKGGIFQNYTIMALGEIELPRGEELVGFSWRGMLPGFNRRNDPYIKEWRNPLSITALWDNFIKKEKMLRLLITSTNVNHNVFLERYNGDFSGGYGDYTYNIIFKLARDLKINAGTVATVQTAAPTATTQPPRPSPPPARTHTVVAGDNLWAIAQRHMGNGNRYPQLYEANRSVIDPRNQQFNMPRYTIYPGQVLTIPN